MKRIAFWLSISMVLSIACSTSVQLDIDNPLNNETRVSIDGEAIVLPPNTTTTLEVESGKHSIRLDNDSIIIYTFDKGQYLINPTLTDYLIEKIYFSKSGNPTLQAMFDKANRKTVTFLGYQFEGNYEVHNELIMPRDWHYKQRQAVPNTITVENKKFSASKNIRKLYAADESLQLLEDQQ